MTESDSFVWVSTREFAQEFRKTNRTVQRWCSAGFVLSLGYRIRRDATGHWEVGIPCTEYSFQFRKRDICDTAS